MINRRSRNSLRQVFIYLILLAFILSILQWIQFVRLRPNFPSGMIIASIPVGSLKRQEGAQRLVEVYSIPVELHYDGAVILMKPEEAGFQLDLEGMLAASELNRLQQPSWLNLWDYLWGRKSQPMKISLRATYSEDSLRKYLKDEIAARYDRPPFPALPRVGTLKFQPGIPGTALDVDHSVQRIKNALFSASQRVVDLPFHNLPPPRPSLQNLEIFLKQTIELSGFDGLTSIYLLDLQTGQEIHFAYRQGEDLPSRPDVAYTGASIIKIPIMVSVFRRVSEYADPETIKLLEEMIERSGNAPADWIMERIIDRKIAPILVSADMESLGLEDTFLAGQFYSGAPLLKVFETPANQRTDIDTDPDIYNQTSPSDMGMLLADIYQCSQNGGGALVAVFPGEITQAECQTMIDYLTRNKLPELITKGLPEGTRIAHKHGWVTYLGVMNTLGDAAIIFTPGGNYVLVVFLYQPTQLVWEPASKLVANLSEAVYNFFNLPVP